MWCGFQENWRNGLRNGARGPGIISAAELLESGIILGQENVAIAAARLLAQDGSGATSPVRGQAKSLLARADETLEQAPNDLHQLSVRERIRDNPRDALAWVELALAQMQSGNSDHAEKSMVIALRLTPENRHVVRSASRLYFQCGDVDRALRLVARNPSTPHDPWLMAAEITLAMRLLKSPRFLKLGLQLIESDQYIPRQITELVGAAATTVILDNLKRGKRLFRKSVADPTGNALAQAQWAEQSSREQFISAGQLQRNPDATEASAQKAYMLGDFENALRVSRKWLSEEPFSILVHFAATASANACENYPEAEKQAHNGLRFHPRSAHLRNWLVLSLASQGRLEEELQEIRKIKFEAGDEAASLVSDANRGLIAMRQGDVLLGESLFAGFRHLQQQGLARTALAFFSERGCTR